MDIEITADQVRPAIRAAYDLSQPVGMGFLHARPGSLDEETVERIATDKGGVRMDYVHGRQCKFNIKNVNGRYFIRAPWFDHTDADLKELVSRIGGAKRG